MSKANILIVEDEQIVAMDIQNSLENCGFTIVGQTNRGEEAIQKAAELNPDLVMMDIGLKGEIDGIEAAMQIREQLNLPVIFLTAFADEATLERARLAEPYGYILKPFEERELVIVIEMALYKHDMEKKLRESENKFRSVIEQATDGIALLDRSGNIVEWNPALEKITGLKRTKIVGQPIWEITFQLLPKVGKKAATTEDHALLWSAVIENGYSDMGSIIEREIETSQGEHRTIQSNEFALKINQGTMAGVIVRDITERRLLEQNERDQRLLAEALLDTAMALNSTLQLDDILDRILDNVGKLVKYDSAMVLLVEGKSVRKIRYRNNRQNPSTQPVLGDIQANLINVPILNAIITTQKPWLSDDIQKDARWDVIAAPGMQRIHSFICAPIVTRGNVVGLIDVVSAIPGFFTPLHTERIMAFATQAAVAFENARLFEQARHLSLIDPLTELYNMRYFQEFAKREFERIQRYDRTLSIAMIDIDHFKNVNDTYGHRFGDIALREISRRISNSVRSMDIVARYGGEEFIVLMPETNSDEAFQIAERIRLSVVDSQIEKENVKFSVSLSLGIAELSKKNKNLEELMNCADQALYSAKGAGRNQVFRYKADE